MRFLLISLVAPLFVGSGCSSGGGDVATSGSTSGGSGAAPGSGKSGAMSSGLGAGAGGVSSGQISSGSIVGTGSGSAGGGSGDAGASGARDAGSGDASAGAGDGGVSDSNAAPAKRFACPGGTYPAPIAGQSQPICAAFNFKYNWNEGPTWITSQQAFFFSNFPQGAAMPGDIIKYTPGGQCEVWVADAACNGLTAAFDGTLVGVCQGPRAVVAYDVVTKQSKILADHYMGQMLDSPNDVVAHSNGSIYFTNPTYELGGRPVGVGNAILYIDPTGTLNMIQKGGQPNGITLSADEKRLYAVGGGVWDVDAKGVPTKANVNFPLNADGISTDCANNIYLSGGQIIDPTGKQIGTFPGGTMAAFGGADGKTLIVVGGGRGVHTVQMNIPGPPH